MLKGLLAISGYPGLYKLVSSSKNAFIVESLQDKKRMTVKASAKISTLEEISVFTQDGEMPLKDVFVSIKEKEDGKQAINHKSEKGGIKA